MKLKETPRRSFVGYAASVLAMIACKPRVEGSALLGTESGDDEFDYIVVGSGAGGGPVAVNLAKAGFKTLVIEAGIDQGNREVYKIPGFHTQSTEDENMAWDFYVQHYKDEAQAKADTKFLEGKGVLYPRAGTLGGCTAHNAMITVAPRRQDWRDLAAALGNPSYGPEVMRRYFQLVENASYVSAPGRRLGWLPVRTASPLLIAGDRAVISMLYAAASSMKRGALKSVRTVKSLLDLVFFRDTNEDSEARDSTEQLLLVPLASSANGSRYGTRDLLKANEGPNLVLRTGCLATKVVFEADASGQQIAKGVEYLPGQRLYRADKQPSPEAPLARTVRARREVILAGGAFNTPQLMMLSGIGPAEELKAVASSDSSFKVLLDRPGVGRNLQDRYEVGVVSRAKKPLELIKNCKFQAHVTDPCYAEWKKAKGPFTSNGGIVAVMKKSTPSLARPDLFMFALPSKFVGYRPGYSEEATHALDHFTWAILKADTQNQRGAVKLRSLDPRDTPLVDLNYFAESDADADAVVQGVEYLRQVGKAANYVHDKYDLDVIKDMGEMLAGVNDDYFQEVVPGAHVKGRARLRQWVKDNAWGHHACGTCKMGREDDPDAVVDDKFRVIGVKGLRIVDASIFPKIPGYFIVSSIYAMAERAADEILADAGRPRRVKV